MRQREHLKTVKVEVKVSSRHPAVKDWYVLRALKGHLLKVFFLLTFLSFGWKKKKICHDSVGETIKRL